MSYKYKILPVSALMDLAQKTGAQVGDDVAEHFINVVHKGDTLVSMSCTMEPVKHSPLQAQPHMERIYHFVFEKGVLS